MSVNCVCILRGLSTATILLDLYVTDFVFFELPVEHTIDDMSLVTEAKYPINMNKIQGLKCFAIT